MGKLKKLSTVLITALIARLLVQSNIGSLPPIVVGNKILVVGNKIWLKDHADALEKEVRRNIPVGSSIASARERLELNGLSVNI